MDEFESLTAAKDALVAQRALSRAEARRIEAELNRAAEVALDEAVRKVFEAGASRSAIARALRESRVTVNERLDRAYGTDAVVRPTIVKVERTEKPKKEEPSPYTIEADVLKVDYVGYGPDALIATGEFDIIFDEEDSAYPYWFLSRADDSQAALNDRLDGRYEGWYYEDALKFVKAHYAQ